MLAGAKDELKSQTEAEERRRRCSAVTEDVLQGFFLMAVVSLKPIKTR